MLFSDTFKFLLFLKFNLSDSLLLFFDYFHIFCYFSSILTLFLEPCIFSTFNPLFPFLLNTFKTRFHGLKLVLSFEDNLFKLHFLLKYLVESLISFGFDHFKVFFVSFNSYSDFLYLLLDSLLMFVNFIGQDDVFLIRSK